MPTPAFNTRALPALDRKVQGIAVGEISSKYPQDLPPAADKMHAHIALPFQAAMKSRAVPRRMLDWDVPHTRKGKGPFEGHNLQVVAIGKEVFLFASRRTGFGERQLELFPPVPAEKWSAALDDKGYITDGKIKSLFGSPGQGMTLIRPEGAGETTHVRFGGVGVLKDVSYAWALWESATIFLRRLAIDASDIKTVPVKTKSEPREMTGLVEKLVSATDAKAFAGPPVAHDLLDAFSWQGKVPVAITSRRGNEDSITAWVAKQTENGPVWMDLLWPEGTTEGVPVRGASAVLDGDTLHLFGGVDLQGQPLDTHWTYDLSAGLASSFQGTTWRRAGNLGMPAAWPAVGALDLGGGRGKGLYSVGGIGAVANVERPAEDGQEGVVTVRELIPHRSVWMNRENVGAARAAAPANVTGASTATLGGVLFVGPGNARDGRVFVYDRSGEASPHGTTWFELPELPVPLGLGQLSVDGHHLVYSGGFDLEGKPSKEIYRLDLNDADPKWEKTGESDFVAGKARLVKGYGKWISLMVAPPAPAKDGQEPQTRSVAYVLE